MTLPFNLQSFEGNTTILGSDRFVKFGDEEDGSGRPTLRVYGLSTAEAVSLLALVSGTGRDAMVAVRPQAPTAAGAPTPVESLPTAEPSAAQVAPKARAKRNNTDPKPEETKADTKPAETPASAPAETPPPAEEPKKDPWGIAPPGTDPDAKVVEGAADLAPEVVKQLSEADKLRTILQILVEDQKIRSFSKLLATCEALKPHSVVLERVENLEERLKRATETLGMELTA